MKSFTLAVALTLPVLTFPAAAQAEDLEFMLTNLSSRALVIFQTSPTGVESWEEDVFGENYLPSGNQVPITIADGRDVCVYDLRFVMEDEAVLEHFEVDLCEMGEYTLQDAE
ncbi:MAG: hypothetical protein KKH72_09615 [Alphaproteobacteria bacterium]|nr:hypothetical protein [Alphaproteobacteria bacterium]